MKQQLSIARTQDLDLDSLLSGNRPTVDVVLEDPSYLSSTLSVERRSRRELRLLAARRFDELAGDKGIGNWFVMPEGAAHRLYVLALDPGGHERQQIQSLVDADLCIASISSSLMPARCGAAASTLVKVCVREECVQVALARHGHWVFARREERASSPASDAIESTLLYLQSQGYLEIPYRAEWRLQAKDEELEALRELWGIGGCMGEAPTLEAMPVKAEIGAPFHCYGIKARGRDSGPEFFARATAAVCASLLLAHSLPLQLVAHVEAPTLPEELAPLNADKLEREYWQLKVLQKQSALAGVSTSAKLKSIVQVMQAQAGVSLVEVSVSHTAPWRIKATLDKRLSDPLQQQSIYLKLQHSLEALLPEFLVSVDSQDGYSLAEHVVDTSFEVMLAWRPSDS
ncbi:MAG: hypothetical protein ACPGSC_02105 [Granulosicoccaceae bacterium]